MKFITIFLKKRRRKIILKSIYSLRMQSAKYKELSETNKINSEFILSLIRTYQTAADCNNDLARTWLSCNLSDFLKKYSEYQNQYVLNHVLYENTEEQISLLKDELNDLL